MEPVAVSRALEAARESLKTNAKTFFFAWLFLPSRARKSVASLYAFCRFVDDLADCSEPGRAEPSLQAVRQEILNKKEWVRNFADLGIQKEWLLDLMDGVLSDVVFKRLENELELDLYCYRVAGVVGLMMCPLLGVKDERAWQHAVDLGTAMQLTNIARDVADDLSIKRIYIPRNWQLAAGLNDQELKANPLTRELVKRLLERAELYYTSGRKGLGYLPWRVRLSIALALEIYREIGTELKKQDFDPFKKRAMVTKQRKVIIALKTIVKMIANAFLIQLNKKRRGIHDSESTLQNTTWRKFNLIERPRTHHGFSEFSHFS